MTDAPDYVVYNRTERLPKRDLIFPNEMNAAWPPFMLEDDFADIYWDRLYEYFPAYLFYICDDDTVLAEGKCIPLHYDGDFAALPAGGWDWALETGIKQHEEGIQPNVLCALEMAVSPLQRGKGISRVGLRHMREIARSQKLDTLIAPVRPSEKHQYPLMPMADYAAATRDDGYSIDAWLRTHQRLGATLLHVCEESMCITGTVAEWESWSGMRFPGTGWHIVPQALQPVYIDVENDTGRYIEANVWMQHPLEAATDNAASAG